MNRDQKTAVIDEIADQIQSAEAIFAVDYRGISVAQIGELRAKLRDADARFRVVKNSLSERAADKAGVATLKSMLVGPTALAFVRGDAAQAAKALSDTARQLNLLDFKGGVLNGAALSADDVRFIARLPAREVLHAQLVATVAAPLTGLARGLNALIAGVAIQLQAIVDQGLLPDRPAAGAAAPAEPVAAAEPAPAEPPTEPEGAVEPVPAEPEAAVEPAPAEPEAAPTEPEGAVEPEAAVEPVPAEPEAAVEPAPAEPEAAVEPVPAELEAAVEPETPAELPAEPAATQESDTHAASDAAPSDE